MRIIFCLPGNNFSGRFIDCWTRTLVYANEQGWSYSVSRQEEANIYLVRNKCLGADARQGKDQKPFQGQRKYDKLFWIDSDIIWTPSQIHRLLNAKEDIASGWFRVRGLASCGEVDDKFFQENGYERHYTVEEVPNLPFNENGYATVGWTAIGFTAIKYGVFESVDYPWFRPELMGGELMTEDLQICVRLRDKYRFHVHPQIRVGHEKKMIT